MAGFDDVLLARALHVLCVVHWIGGAAFVTGVVLPLARRIESGGWLLFERIERGFSAQVKWTIPLAGLSGLWMCWRLELWDRFGDPTFWWMDAMAALWALFMILVFVAEPLAHRRLEEQASRNAGLVLARLWRAHVALIAAGIVTIFGAVIGSHGGF